MNPGHDCSQPVLRTAWGLTDRPCTCDQVSLHQGSTLPALHITCQGATPWLCCPATPLERNSPETHTGHTCGSTMSGHLRALLMMSALSMLRLSFGSPSSTQARIVTGSPITLASLNCALQGMAAVLQPPQTTPKRNVLQAGPQIHRRHSPPAWPASPSD